MQAYPPHCEGCTDEPVMIIDSDDGDSITAHCPECGWVATFEVFRAMQVRSWNRPTLGYLAVMEEQREAARRRKDRRRKVPGRMPRSMGDVYFISDGTYIKIGFTTQGASSRINDLQTGNPRTLTLLATARGTQRDELDLHARLLPFRVGGEWFEDCEEVRVAMDQACR